MEMEKEKSDKISRFIPLEKREKIKEFFEKNKSLVYILPIFLVLIIVLIVVYSLSAKDDKKTADLLPTRSAVEDQQKGDSSKSPVSDSKIEVLPQKEREDEEGKGGAGSSSATNPFTQPMTLAGLITSDNGENIAIIRSTGKSFIVKEGDMVDLVWTEEKIEEKGVSLSNGDKSTFLHFKE